MAQFKRGQIVKSSGNLNTTYKVKTLHRNGDMTIVSYSPRERAGFEYRIMHGPDFDNFTVVS